MARNSTTTSRRQHATNGDSGLARALMNGVTSLQQELSPQDERVTPHHDNSIFYSNILTNPAAAPLNARTVLTSASVAANAAAEANRLQTERSQAVNFIVTNPSQFHRLQSDLRKSSVITTECSY
mmetsp:Transcript_20787/g.44981  ORF Transcript_20787/g.44981 Transcript_20787/m.44981 type:complete len:125 (+) Transcript_20787:244-618(+)